MNCGRVCNISPQSTPCMVLFNVGPFSWRCAELICARRRLRRRGGGGGRWEDDIDQGEPISRCTLLGSIYVESFSNIPWGLSGILGEVIQSSHKMAALDSRWQSSHSFSGGSYCTWKVIYKMHIFKFSFVWVKRSHFFIPEMKTVMNLSKWHVIINKCHPVQFPRFPLWRLLPENCGFPLSPP